MHKKQRKTLAKLAPRPRKRHDRTDSAAAVDAATSDDGPEEE